MTLSSVAVLHQKGRCSSRVNKCLTQGFPTRGARQHLWGCEMVIQIFVLHFCPVMLSSSCANSSAQSVSNYSMPNARPSIQPETMLISKKKMNTRNFSLDFKIGSHLDQGCHIGFFKARFLELVMTFFFGDHPCKNGEGTAEFACFSLK